MVGYSVTLRTPHCGSRSGEEAFSDFPVLQHVAYTRRCAQIILKHIKSTVVIPYQVDTGNMDINIIRNLQLVHFAQEMRARVNDIYRNYAILNNKLVVVNILQEQVQRGKSLLDALLHKGPFAGSDDAGDNIKREYLLYPLAAVVTP